MDAYEHMMATRMHGHDAATTSDLAEIIGLLRSRQYGGILSDLNGALRGAADRFVNGLAGHLRHEEDVLFPALREAAPEAAWRLVLLIEDHQGIREYAFHLAERIAARDAQGACGVARAFLAALFDHIDRETKATDDIAACIDSEAARRLKQRLEGRTGPQRPPRAEGPDLVDPTCGC